MYSEVCYILSHSEVLNFITIKQARKLEAEKSTIVFIFWFYIISRVHKRYECATAYPRVYNYVISATCR